MEEPTAIQFTILLPRTVNTKAKRHDEAKEVIFTSATISPPRQLFTVINCVEYNVVSVPTDEQRKKILLALNTVWYPKTLFSLLLWEVTMSSHSDVARHISTYS